jgi:signal peptidase I
MDGLEEEALKSRRELPQERQWRKPQPHVRGYILTILVMLVVVFGFIRPFVVEAFRIPTQSMVPTLEVGDRVLANKFIYRLIAEPKRGDIVILKVQTASGAEEHLAKRAIGLPQDEIEVRNGQLFLNGAAQKETYLNPDVPDESSYGPTEVPAGHVFVMGDNRAGSADSRFIGPVPQHDIVGQAFMRVWPPSRLELL